MMPTFSTVFAALALLTTAAQAGKRGLTWTYCTLALILCVTRMGVY